MTSFSRGTGISNIACLKYLISILVQKFGESCQFSPARRSFTLKVLGIRTRPPGSRQHSYDGLYNRDIRGLFSLQGHDGYVRSWCIVRSILGRMAPRSQGCICLSVSLIMPRHSLIASCDDHQDLLIVT